ncbi:MAG: hypothetical protein J7K23_09525 [Thermoproteales archaeon]|nr:hypothetical protein [Thermoproteales archaeon]
MSAKELTKSFVDFSIAFLLWLFSIFIFIPLAKLIPITPPLYPIVSFIVLVSIISVVYKASLNMLKFINWIVGYLEKKKKIEKAKLVQFVLLEILIIVDSILLIPLTWLISPVFGGILLIIALFLAIIVFSMYSSTIAEKIVGKLID